MTTSPLRPTILPYRGIWPRIHPGAFCANAVLIGDLEVAEDANIWFNVTIRADVNRIRIGRRTNIQDGTVIHCNRAATGDFPTLVGDDVLVGHMVLLHGCTVGDGAFIGMKACVMDGAVVEPGAMVAAGALVTPGKVVRTGELWAGSPASLLRPLTDKDRAIMAGSIPHYVEMARQYLGEVGGTAPVDRAPADPVP